MSVDTPIGSQGRWVCWSFVAAIALTGFMLLKSSAPPSVESAPAKVLHNKEVVTTQAPVQHYKKEVKLDLNLPKAVQDNPNKQVLAATDLAPSKRERTVSTVLDLSTGEAIQYVQEKELPWLGAASVLRLGVYAGIKTSPYGSEPSVRAALSKELFAVKETRAVVHGSVDFTNSGRTDAFIGVGVEW